MPELPEVETVRRQLAAAMTGRTIRAASVADGRLTRPAPPEEVAASLAGETVADVGRRGKYLVIRFDSGLVLLAHLRMTGSFGHGPAGGASPDPHGRAELLLDDGTAVRYRDVRRFGTWALLTPEEADAHLGARLGHEPLGGAFTAAALGDALEGRRGPVKAAILDQRVVAGVGNIYADEALWYARVDPRRRADSLTAAEVAAIHRGIRRALRLGVERQGSTLRDYRAPDGARGEMQDAFRAYDRDGEPCTRCGTPIAKIRLAGRGTHFCPVCQS